MRLVRAWGTVYIYIRESITRSKEQEQQLLEEKRQHELKVQHEHQQRLQQEHEQALMLHQQQQLAAQRQLSDRQLQQLAEQRQQVLHQRQVSDHKLPPPPTTTNPRDSVASSAGHGEHMPPLPHAQRKLDPASFAGTRTCTFCNVFISSSQVVRKRQFP